MQIFKHKLTLIKATDLEGKPKYKELTNSIYEVIRLIENERAYLQDISKSIGEGLNTSPVLKIKEYKNITEITTNNTIFTFEMTEEGNG